MKEYLTLQRIGVEPPRSYYVPFAESDEPKYSYGIIDRFSSSRFISLDGTWQFAAHGLLEECDVSEALNATIPVPSCVQMHGFDQIQYINSRYPFPFDPPRVPHENPCFHYRRQMRLNKNEAFRYYLNFEGVDSAFYVYVNGAQAGYSQVSHCTSEFDVTDSLVDGINTLDVVVLKWCASSYLECQDKFRFSGIFRSVYLLVRPREHITDYKIETHLNGSGGELVFRNESKVDVLLTFDGQTLFCQKGDSVSANVENVARWTAEHPDLYDLKISACGEVIYEKVGFVESKVVDGIFTVNGEAVKLKGVNRHEFNCETGATVTLEDVVTDLQLIKSLNCNAIRTSHYPDMPQFYQLCDVFGLYIMDEADVETHGAAATQGGYSMELWRQFAEDEFWTEGIFDRHRLLVERDKNRPCVVMWSLGNESAFGKAFFKGAKYIRKRDSRPVHYEGLQNAAKKYYYSNLVDVVSVMYPQYDFVEKKYLTDKRETRPLVFCEYAHAMGNSGGDLAYYWDIIYRQPRLLGAFVWEWADHAIKTEQGFKYGGDFGEAQHDSNFCVDGLVTADRQLKSAALEMKAVYGGKVRDEEYNRINVQSVGYGKQIDVKIDERSGEIYVLDKVSRKPLTTRPLRVNATRAYTDNDAYGAAKGEWQRYGVDICRPVADIVEYGANCALVRGKMAANCLQAPLTFELSAEWSGNELSVGLSYEIAEHVTGLPRVGIEFATDEAFGEFTYCGFGPYESYVDKHMSSSYGKYTSTARESVGKYVMPQETGSHFGSDFLDIHGFVSITADSSFSFSVLPYSTRELTDKRHAYELKTDGNTYVCLDVAMRGVGSNSCGPTLLSRYEIPRAARRKFTFKF